MVSAAGFAPAIPRSQAECVGCYATRCRPRRVHTPGAGEMQDTNPDNGPAVRLEIGGPEGSCTLIFPADNPDASGLIELRRGSLRPRSDGRRRLVGGAG